MTDKIILMFSDIARKIKSNMDFLLKEYNLTACQNSVLVFIDTQQELYNKKVVQKDIENEFGIKGSSVNSILGYLQEKQFVEKQNSVNDKRKKYIVLKEKTKALLARGKAVINSIKEKLLTNISEEDKKNFFNVLEKMQDNLEL